jgi:hypothetical protein
MSAVLSVKRIVPQPIQAVKVALGPNGQTAGLIASLLALLDFIAGYHTESLTGSEHHGGWRIKLTRPNEPELIAYPNDWILVTDAGYDDQNGWQIQSTSRAYVYGRSTGMSGTAANFVDMFTIKPDNDNPLEWPATDTSPPLLMAQPGLTMLLTFSQPVSANGPFDYTVNLTDITDNTTVDLTPQWDMDDNGLVSMTIPDLIELHEYSATVDVKSTKYTGVTATSTESTRATAEVNVEVPETPVHPSMMAHRVGAAMPMGMNPLSPGLMTPPPITQVNN